MQRTEERHSGDRDEPIPPAEPKVKEKAHTQYVIGMLCMETTHTGGMTIAQVTASYSNRKSTHINVMRIHARMASEARDSHHKALGHDSPPARSSMPVSDFGSPASVGFR